MLLSDLIKKLEYTQNITDCEVTHITCDSREAREGSIFVCIKGFSTDGHLFAMKAYQNGCKVFVCERRPEHMPEDARIVLVKSSRRALAILSCELYRDPSKELTVIGITGTKGKTTTALMVKQMLDEAGIPTGYVGSNGVIYGANRIEPTNTTPESYRLQQYMRAMLDCGMKAVVMEISSQALKFGRVFGIKFDITMFTNLSPDHIGPSEHDSFEDYLLSKKKLFDDFEAKTVIANADDPHTSRMLSDCKAKKILYSLNAPVDYRASDISLYKSDDVLGTKFLCHTKSGILKCTLNIPGDFNVHNALATVAIARELNINSELIENALAKMSVEGRFETVHSPNGTRFVIDYAHNGLSLSSAITALRQYGPDRIICLFGSVGCRTHVRRAQLGKVASEQADFSILTSDNPDTEDMQGIINEIALQFTDPSQYISIPDRAEAIKYAFSIAKPNDIVLLAGKGHERYQLINGQNEYFCEREIIEKLIEELEPIK